MGQAKQRGNYEQRKAEAKAKNQVINTLRRPLGKSRLALSAWLMAAAASLRGRK